LVVTLAMLEGFQAGIRAELVMRAAHAEIRPRLGRRLESPDRLASVLQSKLGDVEIVQVVRGTCLVSSDVDAVPALVVGRSDTTRVSVDRVLASRIGVGAGDSIEVISARQRLTPMGPLPVRIRTAIDRTAAPEPGTDSGSVIVPLARAQKLLWGSPVVEAIELRDEGDPWRLGERARHALAGGPAGVEVAGLEELHQSLLTALALERVMIFIAVGLMLVVAALNLLCNVAMVAAEKRRDLAVLAGLGLTPTSLRRLFLVLGVAIGLAGTLAGAVFGSGLAVWLDRSEALELPRGVFMVAAVPFRVDPLMVSLVMIVALGLSAGAAWLPARLVARREPAEGLRHE
jgi:lipoprotein-releasing system permease protein